MKFNFNNSSLTIAFGVSLLAHAALLAIRFTAPDAFRFKPTDPGLEVILVNAKHDKQPLKAEALAQANLDGGGNAEAGRSRSPLPDLRKTEDGDTVKQTRRKIEKLEESQQRMLAQLARKTPYAVDPLKDVQKPKDMLPQPLPIDDQESAKALARAEAEIHKNIEEYNKRPKKTQITPSTKEVGYAMYYKALQTRIEQFGTLNFPQQNGKKLYGELIVYIPIYQDGSIYERDGGPRVEQGSGNRVLDDAALRIVRRASPFGRIPQNMRSRDKDDVWEIVTRFKFTRDDALQAELRGGG